MAIIGEIRKHYWLLVAIIGVALLLFVLSDFSRKRTKQTNTIGVIAGEKISAVEFNKKVEENIEVQKANSGKDNMTADESYQIRQGTWQQLMSEIVMNKQYEILGVSVTVDELDDLIRGKNPHQYIVQSFTDPNTGKFDPKAVTNFLQNLDNVDPKMKERYLAMEKGIRTDRLTTKYNSLLTKAFYLPKSFAKRSYEESAKTAQVRLTGVRYSVVPDSMVTLTDADYEKYYKENSYRYVQDKPIRDIEYVLYETKASEEDMKKIKEDVVKLYQEFTTTVTDVPSFVNSVSDTRYDSSWKKRGSFSPILDSVLFSSAVGTVIPPLEENNMVRFFKLMDKQSRPDSLKASHILISYAGSQKQDIKRTKDAAIKESDSILAVVKKNPASFESLAGTISDDDFAKKKMGDLGWFADGSMVPEFNTAVLKGNVGDIVKVETAFGFHIIKITGKKDPSPKIRVAAVDRRIEPSTRTIENVYNQASAFAAENNTLEKFEKAVKDKGLNLRKGDRIDAMADNIPGVQRAREVVRWAFNTETKKGSVSNVFETDGSYVVAALKNVVDKGPVPLDVLKDGIKPLVLRDKKAELIIKRINTKFASLKDINQIIQEYRGKIDTVDVSFASANVPGYGREVKLTGKIFTMKKGQLSAPIQGEQAVYVVILDGIKDAPATTDFENQRRQMAMNFQNRAGQIPTLLEEKAKVTDNRPLFY
jgi:peptidyl-prolyl cis-trans isomerase D